MASLPGAWVHLPGGNARPVGQARQLSMLEPMPCRDHPSCNVDDGRGRLQFFARSNLGVAALLVGAAAAARVRRKSAVDRGHRFARQSWSQRSKRNATRLYDMSNKAAVWTPGLQDNATCPSEAVYHDRLTSIAALPQGFQVGTTQFDFSPAEVAGKKLPMDLSLICLDRPTDHYAAVFTSNAFPGSPVLVGRRRLAAHAPLQGVVVNNKISNVFPSGDGQAASEEVCTAAAAALGLPYGGSSVLPASTGVIGWRLPVTDMLAAMPDAVANLQSESALPLARGIMTTDRYPKVSAATLPGGARIVGVAKGAGMIEPNMATMLCFIMTDAALPCSQAQLQETLTAAVKKSFNAISVDSDESTSDTVALLSSKRVPCKDLAAFSQSLGEVCRELAAEVVRNGEGTQHVIRVAVNGAEDDAAALRIGKAVVNGPLFKSAVAGNDPNVGRLVGKVGQSLGVAGAGMASGCICSIGGEPIFENGRFSLDSEKELRLSDHLKSAYQDSELTYPAHGKVVDVVVDLGGDGAGQAIVLGSDLTKEYVQINADYRS